MKSILVSLLLTTSAFLFYGCEGSDPRVEKPLKIKMINEKPCFYFDPFEDMDRFVIRNFAVTITTAPLDLDYHWAEGSFGLMRQEDFEKPLEKHYLFPPSAMTGGDKCVEYGTDIDKYKRITKELKTGIVYSAWCTGYNKKQRESSRIAEENIGEASFATSFYLRKNEQTGKLEAVVVNDTNQTIK
jgi:hypothetical protein